MSQNFSATSFRMSDGESINGEPSNVVDAQKIILSPGSSSPAPPRHVPVVDSDSVPPYIKQVRGNCDLDIIKHLLFFFKMCFL